MTRRSLLAAASVFPAFAALPSKLAPVDEASYAKLIASYKGKVLLVDFWATWCEPCRKEMPALAKLAARLGPKGLAFVTVSADEPEDEARAREFLSRAGIVSPSYLKQAKNDEKFINSIDPKWSGALPANFVYDKTGKRVQSFFGEADLKALETAIGKLL